LTKGSTAVMASRRAPSIANKLNFFPTPPWAVRALLHEVLVRRLILKPRPRTAWEPACGAGHCAIPLREVFDQVYATDVHDWGFGDARDLDFSFCGPDEAPYPIDWVISNPPFVLAEMFVKRGLAIATQGVAMLMRLQWLEGGDRYREFFAPGAACRPSYVVVFAERVPMIEGAWDPEASSATAYAWFVFLKGAQPELGVAPIEVIHLRPGMADLYTRMADAGLASPGESARRAAARKAEA
jgi:hypothetical protein